MDTRKGSDTYFSFLCFFFVVTKSFLHLYLFHLIKEESFIVDSRTNDATLCATQSLSNLTQFSRKRSKVDRSDLLLN